MSEKTNLLGVKYFRLFETLTTKNRRDFKKFIQLVSASKRGSVQSMTIELYNILSDEWKNKNKLSDEEKMSFGVNKKNILERLKSRSLDWTQAYLQKGVTELLKLLKEYLGYEYQVEPEWNKEFLYLQYLNSNRLQKDFKYQFQKCEKILENFPKEEDYFYKMYQLKNEFKIFQTSKNERKANNNLVEAIYWLDLSYYAKKLKLIVSDINESNILNFPINLRQHSNFIQACFQYKGFPIIKAYLDAYQFLVEENETAFENFIQTFNEEKDKFSEGEVRELYILALNYRNRMYQKNRNREEHEKFFSIYLKGVDSGVLLDGMNAQKRYISSPVLKNIFRLGLGLGKIKWAKTYIKEISHFILPEEKEVIIKFIYGLIAFEETEYKESMSLMDEVFQEAKDYFYKMDSRIVLLKACYKWSEKKEDLLSVVDSYQEALRKYISRNKKVSELHQIRFQNFIRYFIRLWRPNYTRASDLQKLIEDIESEEIMVEKQWLLNEAQLKCNSLI